MKPIEIFKVGTHISSGGQKTTFSESDLKGIVESYKPDVSEAPIVVGHPKDNGPAFGWIEKLSFKDGSLFAIPRQLNADFAELVKQGAYKKVSASFYTPDSPTNPEPGNYYLRHLGFLGAQPPALKGLEGIQFNESDEGIMEFSSYTDSLIPRFLRNIREYILNKDGQEVADSVMPSYELDHLQEEVARESVKEESTQTAFSEDKNEKEDLSMNTKDIQPDQKPAVTSSERESLDAERQALEAERAEFAEQQKEARKEKNQTFVDNLISAGKLTPAASEGLTDFMESLETTTEISFGEGDEKKTSAEFFKSFLEALPKQVEFSEVAKGKAKPTHSVDFKAPAGYTVDESQLALMQEAEAYAKENNVSVDEAINLLEGK